MITEIVYMIIGAIGILLFSLKADTLGKETDSLEKRIRAKYILFSAMTVVVTAVLMLVSEIYVPKLGTGKAQIFFGCIGAVAIPLILGLISIIFINKICNRKQKRLTLLIIIAAVCVALACVLEGMDLAEAQRFLAEMDYDSMSLMQMMSFQPKFVIVVRILVWIPTLLGILFSVLPTDGKSE